MGPMHVNRENRGIGRTVKPRRRFKLSYHAKNILPRLSSYNNKIYSSSLYHFLLTNFPCFLSCQSHIRSELLKEQLWRLNRFRKKQRFVIWVIAGELPLKNLVPPSPESPLLVIIWDLNSYAFSCKIHNHSFPWENSPFPVLTRARSSEYCLFPGTSRGGFSGKSSSAGNSQFSAVVSRASPDEAYLSGQILATPNLKIFTFAELKSATRYFKLDSVLGEGGFGKVYKGWVDEKTLAPAKVGSGMIVAIKKLNSESMQGFEEWQVQICSQSNIISLNIVLIELEKHICGLFSDADL